MDKSEITHIINTFLEEEFEIEASKLVPEAHLKDDLGLESLDFVDIAVIVEEEFGFKIKGEDMGDVTTLDKLYDYIHNHLHKTNTT